MLNDFNVKEQGTLFLSFYLSVLALASLGGVHRSEQWRGPKKKKRSDHKNVGEKRKTKGNAEFDGAAPGEPQTCHMSQLAYAFVLFTETERSCDRFRPQSPE